MKQSKHEILGAPVQRFINSEVEAWDVFCGDYFREYPDRDERDPYVFESMKAENLTIKGIKVVKYTSNNGHFLYQIL